MYIDLTSKRPFNILSGYSLIYHYTSLDALLEIVREDNIIMRASHYKYLNDKDEVIKGVKTMEKHKSFITNSLYDNTFIISFSYSADNLSMWYMYSAGYSGCILAFRMEMIGANMIHCIYDEEKAEKEYIEFVSLLNVEHDTGGDSSVLLDFNNKKYIADNYAAATPIGIKNKEFEFENEMRLYYNVKEPKFDHIKYRKSKNQIVPYIEFKIDKDALAEIWIPNNEATELTKASLERMLKQYDYSNTKVKVSNTSFRP